MRKHEVLHRWRVCKCLKAAFVIRADFTDQSRGHVFIHISDVNFTLQLVLNSCCTTTSHDSQINTCHLGIIVTEQSTPVHTKKLAECKTEGDKHDQYHIKYQIIYNYSSQICLFFSRPHNY